MYKEMEENHSKERDWNDRYKSIRTGNLWTGQKPRKKKKSTVFHLELVPEIFQSGSQYSWLCVYIRNPKHQNSSAKMMIEVHTFWNFSPSHRQQHSASSTFTRLHRNASLTQHTAETSQWMKWNYNIHWVSLRFPLVIFFRVNVQIISHSEKYWRGMLIYFNLCSMGMRNLNPHTLGLPARLLAPC
jgi:hypothetical protein